MKVEELVKIVPSPRQIAWQQTEYYGFIHFGINTMTNLEWGFGDEPLDLFNPKQLDGDRWVRQLKEAQMQGVILTSKHHDGFCLWPTATTDYSVKHTPWKNGTGDLVKEVAEACHKYGLKFGVYLSPWDRHEPSYGSGRAYDDLYVAQLTELLTNYGEIFSIWLDGANGEGPNGKKQTYDWERYYEVMRRLQPDAAISVCGPDVRWCGNEAGQTRPQEWSVVPIELQNLEKIAEHSQQIDDGAFSRKLTSGDEDLGSREVLQNYQGELVWFPAEVNTSIRPGWFYHPEEDNQVRDVAELYAIYLKTVGGNSTFLLNLPPNKEGLIHENDLAVLKELGQKIIQVKDQTLIANAKLHVSSARRAITLSDLLADDRPFWQSQPEDQAPFIEISWDEEQRIQRVSLKEAIQESQRVEAFTIYYEAEDELKVAERGTMIGYQKIVEFPAIETKRIRIVFEQFRAAPTITQININ